MLPADNQRQTHFRQEALAVLKESGDESCQSAILALIKEDASIADDARAALAGISKRGKDFKVPSENQPGRLPVKRIERTGDAYVDACFQIEFDEYDESRNCFQMPEAKALSAAGNRGKLKKAMQLAEVLTKKNPIFTIPISGL